MKVLFVDDEESILQVLESLARHYGYEPYGAHSGSEALELMTRHHIPVVFTDLRMPIMDGMELCRQLKQIDPSVTIYALSGYINAYTPSQYKAAGFDGCLPKPFKIDQLLHVLQTAVAKAGAGNAGLSA